MKKEKSCLVSSLFLREWKQPCTGLSIAVLNTARWFWERRKEKLSCDCRKRILPCVQKSTDNFLPSSDCAKAKLYHLSAGFSFANVFECKLSAIEKARSRIKIPY